MTNSDTPYPLRKKIFILGGSGAAIFLLFLLIGLIRNGSEKLKQEYVSNAQKRAFSIYRNLSDGQDPLDKLVQSHQQGNKETYARIEKTITQELDIPKIKLFDRAGKILYNHNNPESIGTKYDDVNQKYFQKALTGEIAYKFKQEKPYGQLLEIYYPVINKQGEIKGIFELYEDATSFNQRLRILLLEILLWPILLFLIFCTFIWRIVVKADSMICLQTHRLIAIREHLKKYLSQETAEAVIQFEDGRRSPFEGKRKNAVFFFSDVRGFTAFSESVEPEKVVDMLNSILGSQAQLIDSRNGYIDKYVGDEVMAIFDDVETAFDVAKDIMLELSKEEEIFQGQGIGIGLHFGDAVFGSIGSEERRDYTAIGRSVNLAARLCSSASRSEILMSEDFVRQMPSGEKSQFVCKDFNLKGIDQRQKVYSVKI